MNVHFLWRLCPLMPVTCLLPPECVAGFSLKQLDGILLDLFRYGESQSVPNQSSVVDGFTPARPGAAYDPRSTERKTVVKTG